jgi:D-proline reductase (dithiol) PrdB
VPSAASPVDYIDVTRDTYSQLGYPPYRWVESSGPVPCTLPQGDLSGSRLGLVASGGIYVAGQIAFHFHDDVSYRLVPSDVETSRLRATHFAYDLRDARSDPNVVFPIDPLRRLCSEGRIGSLASHFVTFMGGIYSARKVREHLAPAITRKLLELEVDVALLVPV